MRPRPRWPEVLTRIEAPCFLDVLRPLADLGGALSLAIDPPSPRERRALWRSALKLDDVAPDIASIARLADEFQLGVSDIEAVAARTRAALAGRKPSVDQAGDDDEDEPSGCRCLCRASLGILRGASCARARGSHPLGNAARDTGRR